MTSQWLGVSPAITSERIPRRDSPSLTTGTKSCTSTLGFSRIHTELSGRAGSTGLTIVEVHAVAKQTHRINETAWLRLVTGRGIPIFAAQPTRRSGGTGAATRPR